MNVVEKLRDRRERDKVNRRVVKELIPPRREDAHKGNFGKVLIVAGSEGMCGAAVLCGRSALRTGSGLVQICMPKELFTIGQIALPEATCVDRSGLCDGSLDLSQYDAIALGPGLGKSEDSYQALRYVLEAYEGPLVIDADGLNLIAEDPSYLLEFLRARSEAYPTIITPHIGEARRLLALDRDLKVGDMRSLGRGEMAERLVNLTGAVVLLKGHDTIIARSMDIFGEKVIEQVLNTTGNPGMATGGSGDCLTGIIASLLGQGLGAFEAARAGAYIHGLAGDLAAEDMGEVGLIAGDIANYTAKAIKVIQSVAV